MTSSYLTLDGIDKLFGSFTALKNIRLDIRKNEFICLLGPSGCGKSTLLRIIAGLEKPTKGRLLRDGQDITSFSPAGRNIGMVFQSYALFPNLTAFQNVAYGLQGKGFSRKEIEEKVKEGLSLVDLENVHAKYPAQLSGGQQQRIALARAIVLSPDFLLLDEPLSALDAKVREKLREDICELQERLGITTIMVTHDQEEALTMADRIVVMKNAEIVQTGTPQEIYEQPNTPFVADFIGAINFIDPAGLKHGSEPGSRIAVRPEHIRIAASPSERSFKALVKHAEFRGSFYRLTLIVEPDGRLAAGQVLSVDVPAPAAEQLRLSRNAAVFIELQEDKLVTFASSALAHA
ncbi:ATP-binding cassette domain-containing protein [Paenibacillus filicis]|uniref:ATP-binding cassette domain-containing protein n=1 Tax=Paenibacillus gyeongsangnamensis TaxID=3388067 RepID=A0ABT4QFS5_9BACL|nr:ATP-binding cassette domain-containing protein [Paenibacillus filicis]MCZ8515739.1 ATP-binding cassette domain-containing protein [Paenibacillus filicis]